MKRKIAWIPIALGLLLGAHTAWANMTEAQGKALTIAASMQGSSKKRTSALRKLKSAATAGDPVAEFFLGAYYVNKKERTTSVYWYRKAAHQGFAKAQTELGNAYYFGTGVAENYKKAVYWWKKAAAQGNFFAQNGLSLAYSLGRGVPKDPAKAKYWQQKSNKTWKAHQHPPAFSSPADCPLPNGPARAYSGASSLDGTWMVNLDATARYIQHHHYVKYFYQIRRGIGLTLPYLAMSVLRIHGDSVTVAPIGMANRLGIADRKAAPHCTAASPDHLVCTDLTDHGRWTDHFTVSLVGPGRIALIQRREPSSRYFIWTRVTLKPGQSRQGFALACEHVLKLGFKRVAKAMAPPANPRAAARRATTFTAACKDAGEHFFRRPSKPVHSIELDGQSMMARYGVGRHGRLQTFQIGVMGTPMPRFDKAIKFIDAREPGPPIRYKRRWPNARTLRKRYSGVVVDASSANVLVTFHSYPRDELRKAQDAQGPVTHELVVTDRRDGVLLATMKYVVDWKDHRICGPIHNHVLSEKAFLARALDFQQKRGH